MQKCSIVARIFRFFTWYISKTSKVETFRIVFELQINSKTPQKILVKEPIVNINSSLKDSRKKAFPKRVNLHFKSNWHKISFTLTYSSKLIHFFSLTIIDIMSLKTSLQVINFNDNKLIRSLFYIFFFYDVSFKPECIDFRLLSEP